jgi:uncharacterized protein YndB with AHSA1/START domain
VTDLAATTRSIIVERVMPYPPEKIWRALTQPALIAEWLMQNDFLPVVGHKFQFRAKPVGGWNGVADGEVLIVDPPRRLAWRQKTSGEQAAGGLKSRRHLDADTGGRRHARAHGAFRLQGRG